MWPGVCPSITFVHSVHTAEDIVKLLCRPSSRIILVFLTLNAGTQFQGEPLQRGGAKYKECGKIWRFSTEIAVYLVCYGSHVRSVEW